MTRLKIISRYLLTLCLLAVLSACGSSGLEVTSEFANTQDIDEGTIVYFENKQIGQVVETKTQGGGMSVVIELDESAAELIAADSAVVVNRLKQGAPLEIYNPSNAMAEYVQNNQTLEGLDSMFQLGAWMVGDAIQLSSDSLTDYVGAFQEYLKSDKFQRDKSRVQDQVSSASSDAQQAIESIGSELATAMEELAASEGEAAQAIEQLGDELSPVVQELAKSGSLLMDQLEAFTQSLEQTGESEQQAGQTFLESLTEMLEKLNESIEKGVNSVDENHGNQTDTTNQADAKEGN